MLSLAVVMLAFSAALFGCQHGSIGASKTEIMPITGSTDNTLNESDVLIVYTPDAFAASQSFHASIDLGKYINLIKFSITSNVPYTMHLEGGMSVIEDPFGIKQEQDDTANSSDNLSANRCHGFSEPYDATVMQSYTAKILCTRVSMPLDEPDNRTNPVKAFDRVGLTIDPGSNADEVRIEVFENETSDVAASQSTIKKQG